MKPLNFSTRLSLKTKPPRKTKQEFKREAQSIINKYRCYSSDINFRFFVNDLVLGLCENSEYSVVNDLIKDLQRLKRKQKNIDSDNEFLL